MFDWDDLKYLLAVARHRSTIAAGKALGLSQSTVHRRLAELERRLGRQLVTRHTTGYRLTEFAEGLLPHAERIEAAVDDFERQVTGAAREVTGVIRVTCPEPIVYRMTQSKLIDRFSRALFQTARRVCHQRPLSRSHKRRGRCRVPFRRHR
jgi:DNA-binding transcriptional LysR family regulator